MMVLSLSHPHPPQLEVILTLFPSVGGTTVAPVPTSPELGEDGYGTTVVKVTTITTRKNCKLEE